MKHQAFKTRMVTPLFKYYQIQRYNPKINIVYHLYVQYMCCNLQYIVGEAFTTNGNIVQKLDYIWADPQPTDAMWLSY